MQRYDVDCADRCPGVNDSVDINGNGVSDCLEKEVSTVSEWGMFTMTAMGVAIGTILAVRGQNKRMPAPF